MMTTIHPKVCDIDPIMLATLKAAGLDESDLHPPTREEVAATGEFTRIHHRRGIHTVAQCVKALRQRRHGMSLEGRRLTRIIESDHPEGIELHVGTSKAHPGRVVCSEQWVALGPDVLFYRHKQGRPKIRFAIDDMPETLRTTLVGRRVTDVVDHPYLAGDPRCIGKVEESRPTSLLALRAGKRWVFQLHLPHAHEPADWRHQRRTHIAREI